MKPADAPCRPGPAAGGHQPASLVRRSGHKRHRWPVLSRASSSRHRETGTSALRRQRLAKPQVVAAGVANGSIADAVGLVDRLLEDLCPGGTQRLEGLIQVVDLDKDGQVAFSDNL